MWPFSSNAWQDVVAKKRSARDEAIQAGSDALAAYGALRKKDEILLATAVEIVENIKIRKDGWTAESVMLAYIERAIEAHAATNCLTEVMFVQALDDARALDKEFAATGRIRGPLHGLPVSFKDMFKIKGVDASLGYSSWTFNKSEDDAVIVKEIRAAGGIPFVKTNVCQTLMSFECSNPVFGTTLNPWNAAFTSGGSTGGEAALLACGGSALGIGSDVGGSLRIPTHYSGIYGMKIGAPRLARTGVAHPMYGFEAVRTTVGPMARSVADLKLLCQTLCGQPGGPGEALAPVPWREVQLPSKLRVGYYLADGLLEQSPACKRAVMEAVAALTSAGHECIQFVPPNAVDALQTFAALTSADGYKQMLSYTKSDPLEPALFLTTLGPKIPTFLRGLLKWVFDTVLGDKIYGTLFSASKLKSVLEYHKWIERRWTVARDYDAKVWKAYEFDFVVCPVQSLPAVPHGATRTLSPLSAGTVYYNVLHLPAGVIPVTRVKSSDVWVTPADGKVEGSKLITNNAKKVYDPKAMEGLPVGVQIVGKEWEDENVIEFMALLDKALGPRGFGPGAWPRY